jgi:flagellar hook-associated protein 2
MGTITSSVGLISGINTGQIIDELMSIESQPVELLQNQLDTTTARQEAFSTLSTSLGSLQTTAQALEKTSAFTAATATSSNNNVLTATAANGAAVGSYNLQVAQLVTTQQMISTGFTDSTNAKVGAGTITIDMGASSLATQTPLSQLNGGAGIGRGQFRITDAAGNSEVINTTSDITVDDVLKQINTALDISVAATVQGNQIVLKDTSGGTGSLTVTDTSGGTSAADLGIAGTSATGTITGTDVNYINSSTLLDQLNDGRGVQLGSGGNDFTVTLADGTAVNVNLATVTNVGGVISAINTASAGKLTASLAPGATGITLTDNSTGGGTMTVAEDNGSQAAADLGLTAAPTGNVINGSPLIAGIDTTLTSSLLGGAGLSLGNVTFTDRNNDTQTLDFAGDSTVQDVINTINNATGVHLQASLNDSGDGIQITDTSGGTGNLTIADADGGQTAQQLGIAGTFNDSQTTIQGANLHKQWVTDNTLISALNGGKGISQGSFTITNAAGNTATVNLSNTTSTSTVANVLFQINSKDIPGVTASINSNGNGIIVTDTSTGPGKLTIADTDGTTTAADLNIAGTATGNSINGAYEKTINVSANDTLSTVQTAINNLNFGVTAQIINDGSPTAPFRLSLTANNSGLAGQVVFDAGNTNLGAQTLVTAQNAAVFLGGDSSAQPLLITSSSNQVTGVIPGVTMTLTGVSDSPVQLNVANDPSGITTQLTNFVTNFNTLNSLISTLTAFNTTTDQGALLLGDSTVQNIQSNMYSMLNTNVQTGGSVHTLADIGITVNSDGSLTFDQDTFNQAYATDPTAVEQLFTATQTINNPDGTTTTKQLGVSFAIDNQMDSLIDPQNGSITLENQGLSQQASDFQDEITSLNQILSDKRNVLEEQFDNMEQVLAGLQTQQESINSLSGASSSSSSSSSSKSSG